MTDIKKIIHIADVHIPNVEEDKPYSQMIENFIFDCCKIVADCNKDEVRIVLAGDIFDFKNKVSPEANSIYFKLLNYLNTIATTIIIAGNHDMLENNKQRKDALSPIFEVEGAYKNIQYADKILNYKSGYIVDNNIIWALYSIWERYQRPNIEEIKEKYPNHKIFGLFHGEIPGARTDIGKMSDKGIDVNSFIGCDAVLCGHIHKRQEIRKNGIPMVYAGSLFQKDAGENVTGHGFVEWNVEDLTYKVHDVENDYSIYKFKISSYEDVEDDVERLVNL